MVSPGLRFEVCAFKLVGLIAGAVLLGAGNSGGYCIYGLSNFVYYALYPPVRDTLAS